MAYKVSGQDIEDIGETQFGTDERTSATFGTAPGYLYNSKTFEGTNTTKYIAYYSGYSYSEEVGVLGNYLKSGASSYSVAKKGTRPALNTLTSTTTAGTRYLNKFDDGELWLSSTDGARTGTKVGYTTSDRQTVFASFCGGGGGGGGGNGTSSGGGGGGAGYRYICVLLKDDSSYKFTIGTAGTGGAVGADGTAGTASKLAIIRAGITVEWTATGGNYGKGGANAGTGGTGGIADTGSINPSSYTQGSYVYAVKGISGGAGGTRHLDGTGVTASFYNYTPEKQLVSFPSTGGGTAGTPSGGGGGGGCALGSGGNGGSSYETGYDAYKQGSGGGGGIFVVFSGRAGGDGGDGSLTLYY